jgi:3-oxoadipate enol-lactonase
VIPYRVFGDGPRRMLFAHSLFANGLESEAVAEPLLAAGWSVVMPDQRGHGTAERVSRPDQLALDELGRDLLAVLDDLGWNSAWLGGGSMGAATSLAAAALAPHRADGLALLAPAVGGEPNPAFGWFTELADELAARGPDAAADLWSSRLTDDVADNPLHRMAGDPVNLECILRALPSWNLDRALAALADYDRPAVVFAWKDDPIHPWRVAEETAKALPRGEVHELRLGPGVTAAVMVAQLAAALPPPEG